MHRVVPPQKSLGSLYRWYPAAKATLAITLNHGGCYIIVISSDSGIQTIGHIENNFMPFNADK